MPLQATEKISSSQVSEVAAKILEKSRAARVKDSHIDNEIGDGP